MQQLEVTLASYQVPDNTLILAEKAVRDYFAAEPPQPPSSYEQQAIQLEIDRLVSRINRLWSKQHEQVKLVESMQKNPFHLWNKKYDAQVKQLATTMQAISQSLAQKDQKQSQQQQWSKQTTTYQEWDTSPQTQAMRQLAAFLNLPQVQSRLRALKQEQQRYVASEQIQRVGREIAQAVQDMFRLIGTKRQPDGSLILEGKNWRILQLGNTVSVTVKADNREILRVEGNKTTVFNPTPFERQKMHSFQEEVQRDLQKRQQHRESERKRSQELSL